MKKLNKKDAKILIPLIRKVYPKMVAEQIIGAKPGVQPIPGNVGQILSMVNKSKWTEWQHTFRFWPRRSVTGKFIFGWINKSSREDWSARPGPGKEVMYMPSRMRAGRRPKFINRFATDKELFTAKLKGET